MIYFDHNATTPMLPEARQAWLEATERFIGNPSSPHRIGSRADTAITGARQRLADFLGCDALDLVWTSGATESNNTVLHHFAHTSVGRGSLGLCHRTPVRDGVHKALFSETPPADSRHAG